LLRGQPESRAGNHRRTRRSGAQRRGAGGKPAQTISGLSYEQHGAHELLQRTADPNAKHSIALPEMPQFRRLWERLPPLAKSTSSISALFVDKDGHVVEVS
jgi:hypothetical protein